MTLSLSELTDPEVLRRVCNDLSSSELEKIHRNLEDILLENRQKNDQRLLKRKGERSLKEMRGLLARAGISMNEFQDALGD